MHALKKKGTTPTAIPYDSLVYPCCHALVLCLLWLELLAAPCYFGLYFVVVGLFMSLDVGFSSFDVGFSCFWF
jgi:hypothetical protein